MTTLHETSSTPNRGKVWIDLDNSPHVPLFAPIVAELRRQGFSVLLTARDCFQVCELAQLHNLPYTAIGHHYGKYLLFKLYGLVRRAIALAPIVLRERPVLAVSHGSRAQLLLSRVLRIPSIWICDYEFVKNPPFLRATWVMVPEVIPGEALGKDANRRLTYSGIKEDVYVPCFVPDPRLRGELGVSDADLLVTVRPPATEAHYRSSKSNELYLRAMDYLVGLAGVRIVLLPRNGKQGEEARRTWPSAFVDQKIVIPERVIEGLNLIWNSDFVISGGGTMNREAAALGVPVYSTFGGKIGAVDKYLVASGRLVLLNDPARVADEIAVTRRTRQPGPDTQPQPALREIVDAIVARAQRGGSGTVAGAPGLAGARLRNEQPAGPVAEDLRGS